MTHEPTITEHDQTIFAPRLTPEESRANVEAQKRIAEGASRVEAEREAAYLSALSPASQPKLTPPKLRQPVLPDDFGQRAQALDEAVFERGIAIDRQSLFELGKARFHELLVLDREVRSLQRVIFTDLTQWHAVEQSFTLRNALAASAVPKVKIAEEYSGAGADRLAAAAINGFADLWKAAQEPQSVRNVLAFRDGFESLIFGQSLLERLSNDGRVHSHFFCGGHESNLPFKNWLAALDGNYFKVTLEDPLGHLFAWLCGEKTPLLSYADLARDIFGVRAPTLSQVKVAAALWHGFILGFHSWRLWDYIGRRSRQVIDEQVLETWRDQLAKRYMNITNFHQALRDFFWRDLANSSGYREFDLHGYHLFIETSLRKLLNRASAVMAISIEESLPESVVARFADCILCEGSKPKSVPTIERIERKLSGAFPGAAFEINIEEAQ